MNSVPKRRLLYNFSSLSIVQASNFLLSVIVIPHVVRKIGADGFGIVSVAQVVMIYLSILVEYGFSQTATRDIALNKESPDSRKISSVFSAVMVSKIIICIFCFALLVGLCFLIPIFRAHVQLYLLAFSFVVGQTLVINWFFMGMEKMQYVSIPALVGKIIFVILVFAFVRQKSDQGLFLFLMGLGNVLSGLFSIYLAFRIYKLKFINPSWTLVREEFRKGWPLTVTNLYITTCQYAGIFILRFFTNDFVVGYYSVAEKIFFAMKMMVGVFTQVSFPAVCRLIQKGRQPVINFLRQTYLPFLLLVIVCAAMVFIFSPWIIFLLMGHEHLYASALLRLFCITVIIVCLNIPPYVMLLADDQRKSYLKIFTLGTAVHLVGNIILANYFQATGTAIAIMITELFITATLYWEAYRIFYSRERAAVELGN